MPVARGEVFITDIAAPKSVTLLRTGETLDYEFRDSALRMVVPEKMRTELPDMVKLVF
jgi:alpha-L-fucosidase